MVHHNSSNLQVSTYVVEMELPPWIMEKTMVDQITPRIFNPSNLQPMPSSAVDYGESWAVAVIMEEQPFIKVNSSFHL